jgi:mevalonate kinase
VSAGLVRCSGKVILAGEHGVVRGGEALVLPLRSRGLELRWEPSPDGKFQIRSSYTGVGSGAEDSGSGPLAEPFHSALSRALEISGFVMPEPGYRITLTSDIPVRAGLGSSAALSVAIVKLLAAEGAPITQPFELAMEIENLFHGKSSGIDVACVLSSGPIRYARSSPPQELPLAWKPLLYLFDTGTRSSTKDCVAKVEAAQRPDLDQRMAKAVAEAKGALLSADHNGPGELANALELAASCFREWGLGADEKLVALLKESGAIAVKPTGSGGGGFLLSLWRNAPPKALGLIPVWEDSLKAL